MKKFLIALSFTLCACTPDTQADDQYQKAESLVVKGLHLGMNADEVKMAVEQQLSGLFQNCEIEHGPPHTGETGATEQHGMVRCRGKDDINNSYYILDRIKFANQKLIEFKFHSSNIETIFNSKGVSRLDFVKAFYDYYKLKIYFPNLADSTKLDHNQRSSFEKNENAYCLVGYGAMECNNKIIGLLLSVNLSSGIEITRYETISEEANRRKEESRKQQEDSQKAAKNLKFD